MIVGGVLVLPLMPMGEIVDRWLSLMSTQAAPGDAPLSLANMTWQLIVSCIHTTLDGFFSSRCFRWYVALHILLHSLRNIQGSEL